MQFLTFWKSLLVICIINYSSLIAFGQQRQSYYAPAVAQQAQEQQQQQQTINLQSHFHGFLDTIVSPLKSTFRQAKRLFGGRLENVNEFVNDNVDMLQAQTFKVFMQFYNKTYSPAEIPRRFKLFLQRRKQIEQSIREYATGKLPFMMRENPYIDWEEHELKALAGVSPPKSLNELSDEEREAIFGKQQPQVNLNGKSGDKMQQNQDAYYTIEEPEAVPEQSSSSSSSSGRRFRRQIFDSNLLLIDSNEGDGNYYDESDNDSEDDLSKNMTVKAQVSIPGRKDWRESNCVAAPVNQRKCGCCYAIATMGVLESMRCIKQPTAPTLSAQQIIDCSTPRAGYENYGCNGGWPTRVLRYLQNTGVAARETCYPLVLRQESCKLNRVKNVQGCTVSASPTNTRLRYKVLNNENDILYHVAKTGPVVTVMKATDKFLYYGSGIFDDPKCSRRADDVDHAISIVGYGRENGNDYWLIKNSWGAEWGQNGYGKYKRGTNACSIGHWGWVITQ